MVIAGFLLVVLSFGAALAGGYALLYRPIVAQLSLRDAQRVRQQVEAAVDAFFLQVETVARLSREHALNGVVDLSRADGFNARYRPIAESGLGVSSIMLADETGRSVHGTLTADGNWMNRLTNPAEWNRRGRFLVWRGEDLITSEDRETDYDPRRRAWFQGAMALPDETMVFWTRPYVFTLIGEPGISAAVRWSDRDGRRYAMGLHVTLSSLTRLTQKIDVGQSGMVAVLSGEGQVLGLPRGPRLESPEAMRGAFLRDGSQIGVPALAQATDLWRSNGRQPLLTHVDVGGDQWVASFLPSRHGSQIFWIAVLIPESEFTSLPRFAVPALLALLATTLLAVWLAAKRMAAAVTRPLASLAADSDRIGTMQLDEPIAVRSPISEIDSLVRAQERMRAQLMDAKDEMEATTARQSQAIQECIHENEQLVQAMEELHRKYEQFRKAIDNSPSGIVLVSFDGRVIYGNEASGKILGYERGAIATVGAWFSLACPDPTYREEARAEWTKIVEEARAGNVEIAPLELRVTSKDGTVKTITLSCVLLADGLLVIFHDITEKVDLVNELENLNRSNQELLDATLGIAVIATDLDGTVTLFNSGAERMLGYAAAEVVGRFASPEMWHLPEELAARAAELTAEFGRPVEGRHVFTAIADRDGIEKRGWTNVRKDGSRLVVSVAVTPMRTADGRISGHLGVAMDVSPVKNAETRHSAAITQLRDRIASLTQREREILEGIVAGCTSKTIAFRLGISIRTVDFYRMQIANKLGITGVSNLVRMSLEAGIAAGPLWQTNQPKAPV
jgi:PAS domain S-box-containing protein